MKFITRSLLILPLIVCLPVNAEESNKVTGTDALTSSKQQQHNNTSSFNGLGSHASKPTESGKEKWYRIYQGSTTGRINISSTYKEINVNGLSHPRNVGASLSMEILPAQQLFAVTGCRTQSGGGEVRCYHETTLQSTGPCTLIVNDSYVQGCSNKKSFTVYSTIEDRGPCRCSSSTMTIGGQYLIKTVTGKK